jgi:hypothetical protein
MQPLFLALKNCSMALLSKRKMNLQMTFRMIKNKTMFYHFDDSLAYCCLLFEDVVSIVQVEKVYQQQ